MPYILNHDTEDLVAAIRVEIEHGDAPAWGSKATYDDDFQAIKTRIDSLGTLSGSIDQEKALSDEDGGSIFEDDDTSGDFTFIVETGIRILAEKSKDLRIACYVALGLYRTDRLSGLAAGLDVLHTLVDTYWENLYPAKRRMRARGAAIGFLMQRLSDAFETDPPDPTVDDRDALEHSLERLSELQSFFMEEMGEHAPITSKLKRLVEETLRKAPEPEPGPEPAASEDGTEEPEHESASADTEASSETGNNDTSASDAAQPGETQPSETATNGAQESPDAAASRHHSSSSSSAADASSLLERTGNGSPQGASDSAASVSVQIPDVASESEAIRAIVRGAGVLRDSDRTDARPYRLVRSVRWDPMQQAPPNDGGQTRIQPPTSQRCDYLRRLLDTGETAMLIQHAEDSFQQPPFHFWLDLQRLLVHAMAGEGDAYTAACASITADIVQLVQRVPDLPDLTFADGTFFADASTRAWITEQVEAATRGRGGPDDAVATAIQTAQSTLASDGLSAALHELQQAPVGNGRRSAFRVRLAKGRLCLRSDQSSLALPLLEALSDDLDAAGAGDFDQTLAVDTWCALYRACQSELEVLDREQADRPDEDDVQHSTEADRIRQRAQETYRRICAMAPARALDLDSPTLPNEHADRRDPVG